MMADTGRRVGRYLLERVIGTGAFATVYLAVDERLEDTVAVKVLADNHCLDPEVRERFISEGRSLRRIDSPHVVGVHDIGVSEDRQPFLVLEHADRGTLQKRVAGLRGRGWRPGHDDVRVVARSLGAAVAALHRVGLVHRDLSPGNVLLRSTVAPRGDPAGELVAADERLVLADLGLCKDLAVHSGLTVPGGTEGFRPPEQRGSPARVDPRADLWALSALLVWLVTGRPPTGRPVAAQLAAQLAEVELPRRLGRVLATSLATDPHRRHRDVAAWLADVEAALTPPPAPKPADADADTTRPRRSLPRRLALLTLVLVGGVLLGGGGVLLAGSLRSQGPEMTVTRLSGGHVTVAREVGGVRVAMTGPAEVTVGEIATFVAELRGVDRWVWIMPDGALQPDAHQVRLRTRSAGIAPISLLGVSTEGDRVETMHNLRVRD